MITKWIGSIKLSLKETKENAYMWVAFYLPRELAKWCAIRLAVYATTGKYGYVETPGVTFLDILKRWDDKDE